MNGLINQVESRQGKRVLPTHLPLTSCTVVKFLVYVLMSNLTPSFDTLNTYTRHLTKLSTMVLQATFCNVCCEGKLRQKEKIWHAIRLYV